MDDIELTPITKDDIETIRNWRNSEEVSKYMYTAVHISKEQQKKWFKKISESENTKYWIISFNNMKLGLAWLYSIDTYLSNCYWAFYLGNTSIRGAGIGSKVEYKVLSYVFEDLKINKLRCEVFTFNEPVIRMHEKFGFRREAYYRQHCKKNDKWEDVVGLAILKEEWEIIKQYQYERIHKHK